MPRDRLGDETYEQAYGEGTAMSYDEGLDYALNPDAPGVPGASGA